MRRLNERNAADATPAGPGLGRTVLGAGGLLVVLVFGALLVRLGTRWLPFAWDPVSPWPTTGDVVPARVVRADLAIFEDPLSRNSGRHRFQVFVRAAPTAGGESEILLAGPAQDSDDLATGSQLAWFAGEAAMVVGAFVPGPTRRRSRHSTRSSRSATMWTIRAVRSRPSARP